MGFSDTLEWDCVKCLPLAAYSLAQLLSMHFVTIILNMFRCDRVLNNLVIFYLLLIIC